MSEAFMRRMQSAISNLGTTSSVRSFNTQRRVQRVLESGITHPRRVQVDDPEVFFEKVLSKNQDRTEAGSCAVLLMAGIKAYLEAPGGDIYVRLGRAEKAMREAAYKYYREPQEGGICDAVAHMSTAFLTIDDPEIALVRAFEMSKDFAQKGDFGAIVLMKLLEGFMDGNTDS
jgi:hypothetical protein